MFAFLDSLGFGEMFLLLVIGLLLYGRNLPEAGKNIGRILGQLRRSFHEFKRQIDADGDLQDVKKSLRSTADELRRAADVHRSIGNPAAAARQLAQEALRDPPPPEATAEAAAEAQVGDVVATTRVDGVVAPDATEGGDEAAGERARTVPRQT